MRSLHQRSSTSQYKQYLLLSQFILSLSEGERQILPGNLTIVLMCQPGSLHYYAQWLHSATKPKNLHKKGTNMVETSIRAQCPVDE